MPARCGINTAPVEVVLTEGYVPVKGRPRPIAHAAHQTMLARVPVNVIDTPLEIVFVAQRVLPISSLPHAAHSVSPTRDRLNSLTATAVQPAFCEFFLDAGPAQRVLLVAWRECPDRVPMVGEQDDGHHPERMLDPNLVNCLSQTTPAEFRGQDGRTAVRSTREEIGAAGCEIASIFAHDCTLRQRPGRTRRWGLFLSAPLARRTPHKSARNSGNRRESQPKRRAGATPSASLLGAPSMFAGTHHS